MKNERALWKGCGIALLLAASTLMTTASNADVATQGRCEAWTPTGDSLGQCPLEHTDVDVSISGFIARVNVTQFFTNPCDVPIEAVYTFPLSEKAAVDAMTLRIGDRTIRGLVKEKGEARAIYNAARATGQRAALLDQERPNIFTQAVANIMPGENIEIEISYVEYLEYEAGEYAFSFPMVVGPRYNPDGAQVLDAANITPPITPEGTRAGHDIDLKVDLQAGVQLHAINSDLHEVDITRDGYSAAKITLKNNKTIPNRDFVLNYKVAGEEIGNALLTHADERGGFFSLILQPPARVETKDVTPKEMIFVIDASGSMRGFPIEKAKQAMRLCIEQMNPKDTFNLISFAGGTGYCFTRPVQNTPESRATALAYLNSLQGGGGTEMMGAIRASLADQNDPERLRVVCFMTDGFIGNDMQILGAIKQHAATARVFSFGIGNSVNRFLIEGMAREGRGASEIVTLASQGEDAATRFHERIHSPLLTDITLDFGGLNVSDLSPAPDALPDLFAARPLIITGRYTGSGEGTVTLRGSTANGPYESHTQVNFPETNPEHDVLASLWARNQVDTLMTQDWQGIQRGNPRADVKSGIIKLGTEFNLLTQFTSFVAVEETIVNENGETRRVDVPIEMPDGVSYEGIIGDARQTQIAYNTRFHAQASKSRPMAQAMMPASAPPMLLSEDASALTRTRSRIPTFEPTASAVDVLEDRIRIDHGGRFGDKEEAERNKPVDEISVDPDFNFLGDAQKKLHPALQGLAARVVNGAYDNGVIRVVNGYVEVFIVLTDNAQSNIDALKKLGIHIKAHTRASKTLHVSLRVENLSKLLLLDYIARITPPRF